MMLAVPPSPVPSITIEYACNDDLPVLEPPSPFDNIAIVAPEDELPRSFHLLPPPSLHTPTKPSPKQVPKSTPTGLDSTRFEALLRAARSPNGTTKFDLRKEVALKAHQSKQSDRRNIFLSKMGALPSPTAASMPVTPPESPAVFHFTLPSPGLVSPLALFETLEDSPSERRVRVEQVDFRARARKEAEALAALTGNMRQSLEVHGLSATAPGKKTEGHAQKVPSLDQISKRLAGNVTISRSGGNASRLPAFLQRPAVFAPTGQATSVLAPHSNSPASSTTVRPTTGRLPFAPNPTHGPIARPAGQPATTKPSAIRPQARPVSMSGPHIASTKPPTPLTASALNALASRAERGSVMVERLRKRVSAPAELGGPRTEHAMLKVRGGF